MFSYCFGSVTLGRLPLVVNRYPLMGVDIGNSPDEYRCPRPDNRQEGTPGMEVGRSCKARGASEFVFPKFEESECNTQLGFFHTYIRNPHHSTAPNTGISRPILGQNRRSNEQKMGLAGI